MDDKKQRTLAEIEKCVPIFRRCANDQYRIRCPICGDSTKHPYDTHCYIKCSPDPTEPILYNCFKCNAGGIVNRYFLEQVGVSKSFLNDYTDSKYNKLPSFKEANIEILTGDTILDSPQVKYIEKRLGKGLTYDDYDKLKIIWDMSHMKEYISNQSILNTLPSNRDTISFLSDDKSMIITRTFLPGDAQVSEWHKIRPFQTNSRSFYTIKAAFNLFGSEPITVNIAEGIFDIISVYKNFNDGPNSAYIAILGSDYKGGAEYAVANGFIGSNVTLKVYVDSNISQKRVNELKPYKWMFNKIIIYRNAIAMDVGRKINEIQLVENVL